MIRLIALLIILLVLLVSLLKKLKRTNSFESNVLTRFRKKFKTNKRIRRTLHESSLELLLNDPKNNIQTNSWDKDHELIEKADIHKARLSRHGESKMNGETYYMGPKGGVFIILKDGKKRYV